MKKIHKKLALFSFVFGMAFLVSVPRALAIPSPTEAMNEILADLGVDKSELKKNIKTMNASRYKKQAPQVSLLFSPTDPATGEKVTATATPTYFMNESKKLYYTWFLKTAGCTDKKDGKNYHYNPDCDLDGNGEVDIEDYKIKATRTLASDDFEWEKESYASDSDADGYKAVFGGDDQRGKKAYCYIKDVLKGTDKKIECDHLFPNAPGSTTGDGAFGKDEESFWHTNPNDPDTAGTGQNDEATVAGLGRYQFSWTFQKGDKVGVVVEGVSNDTVDDYPSRNYDSSYKTMFAVPYPSKCDANDNRTEGTKEHSETETSEVTTLTDGSAIADIGDGGIGTKKVTTKTVEETTIDEEQESYTVTTTVSVTTEIIRKSTGEVLEEPHTPDPTVTTEEGSLSSDIKDVEDMNKCLYKNMIEPTESDASAGKLDIVLNYTPENPVNDPSGISGDEIEVSSSITNARNKNFIKYQWQVFGGDSANPNSWGEPFLKSDLPDASQTSGLGMESFKFKLNSEVFKNYSFLKVKVTATENFSVGSITSGHADVVIPISSTQDKIHVFNVEASESADPEKPTLSLGSQERCEETATSDPICRVSKNEIIGMKVDNTDNLTDFLWTINGDPITYKECFFDGCDTDTQTSTAFFPALDETGDQYEVNLTATDQQTGKKISLTKTFEISDPEVHIVSADETVSKPEVLGYYIDNDEQLWPDYSDQKFIAVAGSSLKFSADSTASLDLGNSAWYVDGNMIDNSNADLFGYTLDDDGSITLPPKQSGESYSIGFETIYSQDSLIRKALSAYWDVPYNDFYEQDLADSREISIIGSDSDDQSASANSPKKILANIYSATPTYLAFLLKIILTAFLMLIIAKIILSFFPNNQREEYN